MVQMKGKALWEKIGILIELYIPHGSDESVKFFFVLFDLLALYPTWFR